MSRKKLLAVMTAMAVTSCNFAMPSTMAEAAATLKLKNVTSSQKTLAVGDTFTLKTNIAAKKITFTTSSKSIATVSKKGVITAKKVGSCTIKVKYKKKTKKIKLTIADPAASATNAPTVNSTVTVTNAPAGNETTTAPTEVAATNQSTSAVTSAPTIITQPDTNVPVSTDSASVPPSTAATNAPDEQFPSTPIRTAPADRPSFPEAAPNGIGTAAPTTTEGTTGTTAPETTAVAAPTATPVIPTSGDTYVASVQFSETGISLADADGNTVASEDASNLIADGTCLTITAPTEGELAISGTCSEGQIIVAVDKTTYPEGEVALSLEGLTLSNTSTSPVYVESVGDNCTISAKKSTTNIISDGTSYINEDNDTGAIYSKDDLKIKGKGTLADGVRSNNPIDDASLASTDSDYADGKEGTIEINGGTITVNAKQGDAFQSAGTLTVNGGTLDITTYQGSNYSNNSNVNNPGNGWENPGGSTRPTRPTRPGSTPVTTSTTSSIIADIIGSIMGNTTENTTTNTPGNTTANTAASDVSAKGLKSVGNMTINDGSLTFDTSDDALHCGGTLVINGGNFSIATGDDGIHSDNTLTINAGNIHITKSYEGIEGTVITFNGGTSHVVSSDDGVNAAGGNTSSTWNQGGFGGGAASSNADYSIVINGGYLIVEPKGDGIDSNGTIYVKGGTTLVIGPTSGSENSFDQENSTFSCTGGVLLGLDITNQMSAFPTDTTNYLTRSFTRSGNATDAIAITDENGNLLSYITFDISASNLTYYNSTATASNCKVYFNPSFEGETDTYGYASEGSVSGGTELTTTSSVNSGTIGRGFGPQ